MKEFSAVQINAFEGLEWRNVLVMLSVLRGIGYTRKEHIKKRYNEHASRFEETLAFMVGLRAVNEEEGHVQSLNTMHAGSEDEGRSWLIKRLFTFRNRYRTQIFRYLRGFHIVNGEPIYHPSPVFRHHQSHVRNFLMEMGIIRHDEQRDCYFITPEQLNLFILSQENANKRTPEAVAANHRARESIGLAAEMAVMTYERDRVGKKYVDRVEHIAIKNAAAGYDVRSVTFNKDGELVPRYIEVKAVSIPSLQFYWTRNEVRTAELLAEWYYLYLLPVINNGRFAIDELEIIANPHTTILQSINVWLVEHDVLRCCQRPKRTHNPGVSIDGA